MEDKLKKIILDIIKDKYNIQFEDIKLDIPPKKELGDYSFGVFPIVKQIKQNPKEIALVLAHTIKKNDFVEDANSDGPYLNIRVSKKIYSNQFNELYKKDFLNIFSHVGNNKTIVVDYIGPNIGKPLHIGHMCTPNQGQAMINVFRRLGYKVIGDSHIGDWGIVFGKLIFAYKMWGEKERLEEDAVNYLFELYVKVSSYIDESGIEGEQKVRDEFKLLSEGNPESVGYWKEFTSYSIKSLYKELTRLNVKADYDIGESFYEGLGLPKLQDYPDLKYDMNSIVSELIEKNIAVKNDDNSVGVTFDEITKLPSTILQKKDGTHGYLASDLACIKYRMDNWNPAKIIYFVDVRQKLHFEQVFEISKLASWVPNTELSHAYNGFISLKDGVMSTRTGKMIKLGDLIDEAQIRAEKIILEKRQDIKGEELSELSKIIGVGAIKYGYLKKSRETDVVFDWDEFMSFEGNSGPYIQYSYVRAIRILENANLDFDVLSDEIFETRQEIELVKMLIDYEKVLIETSNSYMPHVLCKYVYEITKSFSSLYNDINILNEENIKKKIIRLKLINYYSLVLKDAFSLLGIKMPNKM